MMTRRFVLKSGGLALAGMGLVPRFLLRAAEQSEPQQRRKILIALFQRGAADGLNIVVPHAERNYYALRPSIAIPRPGRGSADAAQDLDGFFGLHPALKALLPLYEDKHMAVIHAVGSPDNTRSHFDAQDFMETATPGVRSTRDGWLNRHLQVTSAIKKTPFRAVAIGAALPRSLAGSAPAVALTGFADFDIKGSLGDGAARRRLEALYAGLGGDVIGETGKETLEAVAFLKKCNPQQYQPAAGVEYPRGPFGTSLKQIAQLIKSDVGLEVACAEIGGWDHHANEGGIQGQLAQRLREFSSAIAALYRDLGDRMEDVLILTMSEFGRTAHENGNLGTDHGHANCMFVLGGGIQGGRVYGRWPGLEPGQLNEGRDLALTTDFRDVFGTILSRHLHCADLGKVFPGYAATPAAPALFRG